VVRGYEQLTEVCFHLPRELLEAAGALESHGSARRAGSEDPLDHALEAQIGVDLRSRVETREADLNPFEGCRQGDRAARSGSAEYLGDRDPQFLHAAS
jgi:hypothetical protein